MKLDIDAKIIEICNAVSNAGGKALLVGGCVRDMIMNTQPKDFDIEVYGLPLDSLEQVLKQFGDVDFVGKSFGVFKIHHLNLDISIPRKDSKISAGHKGFEISFDHTMSFQQAAKRRDFTINSIMYDVLDNHIIDVYDGRYDIEMKRLHYVDKETFVEDPLRALRAAQFAARFEMLATHELNQLMSELNLSELSSERIFEEFKKLLLKGKNISLGFYTLKSAGLLKFFPEIEALVGCEQDKQWHPEGDVWTHTLMALDFASSLRTGNDKHDMELMFSVLCHDFGKPSTTKFEDERIRSRGHEQAGVEIAVKFLEKLRAPNDLILSVAALVKRHLDPHQFIANKASPKAYRKLARELHSHGTNISMLYKVGVSDHFGRTTKDALEGNYDAGHAFMKKAQELNVGKQIFEDVVLGRHLIEKGMAPSPAFSKILSSCRDIQYETGLKDVDSIFLIFHERFKAQNCL